MEKKAARWWDKLGKPQYGGEMVIRVNRNIVNFDPYVGAHLTRSYSRRGWKNCSRMTGHWTRQYTTTR